MNRLALGAALCGAMLAGPAEGRRWTVGGHNADFPLIAPALAAASAGDVVLVRGGVYREDLVLPRRVALIGEGGPVLVGTGLGTVITVLADGCEVRGFAIEGSGTGQTSRMDAGIRVASNGNRIVGNRIVRVFYGVVVEGASANAILDNTIAGFADLPFGRRGDGIYCYRAPDNLVRGNRISGMRDAIYFQYAPRCRAEDNLAETSRYGLHDMFSDDAHIVGNQFRSCSIGANVMNSRRIRIAGNRFESNRGASSAGLVLKECDDSRVEDNVMRDNARGLQVEGAASNYFSANRFRDNDTALRLFSSAEENVFTRNDFRHNLSGLVFSGGVSTSRFADRGRGNLWSGYRGFDFDGDGVGDAPHPLLGSFEKLEGNNPAVRLFLQCPAASALELAARSLDLSDRTITDDAPLVPGPAPARDGAPRKPAATRGLAAGVLAAGAIGLVTTRVRPC